jgi:hypothetical protein
MIQQTAKTCTISSIKVIPHFGSGLSAAFTHEAFPRFSKVHGPISFAAHLWAAVFLPEEKAGIPYADV